VLAVLGELQLFIEACSSVEVGAAYFVRVALLLEVPAEYVEDMQQG
jgi:hypothetical protein